jgi:hypothetical protein
MFTSRKPAPRPATERAPAAERGEHCWPVAVAIIVVAGIKLWAKLLRALEAAGSIALAALARAINIL